MAIYLLFPLDCKLQEDRIYQHLAQCLAQWVGGKWLTETLKFKGEMMEREAQQETHKDGKPETVFELKAKETCGCGWGMPGQQRAET